MHIIAVPEKPETTAPERMCVCVFCMSGYLGQIKAI